MTRDDFTHFSAAWAAAYELVGKEPPSATAIRTAFSLLEPVPYPVIRAALRAHALDPDAGQYPPKPADVMRFMQQAAKSDGRPGVEEAWAIALRATDEADSTVWTEDVSEAFGCAQPLLAMGDKIGARMAFEQARAAGRPMRYMVTLGSNPARRDDALALAARLGVAAGGLPVPGEHRSIGLDRLLLIGTTPEAGSGDVAFTPPPKVMERLIASREALLNRPAPTAPVDPTPALKADAASLVRAYIDGSKGQHAPSKST
jgi:hypothetical protein